jgi:hypothetical protein
MRTIEATARHATVNRGQFPVNASGTYDVSQFTLSAMRSRFFGKNGNWTLGTLANAKAADNARFAGRSAMCGEYPYSVHRMAYSCSQRYNVTKPRSVCPRS